MAKRSNLPEKLFPPALELDEELNAEELFLRAMEDVKPLPSQSRTPRRKSRGLARKRFRYGRELDPLNEFVRGNTEFDWTFHPGYQQGGIQVWNQPLIRKLHGGGFSVQAELDLHGHTQQEALAALETFLWSCYRRKYRCVRIIHGKGVNSRDNIPVLKKRVPQWLSMKRLARLVVAFTSAPPNDGGVGATYVLLRK